MHAQHSTSYQLHCGGYYGDGDWQRGAGGTGLAQTLSRRSPRLCHSHLSSARNICKPKVPLSPTVTASRLAFLLEGRLGASFAKHSAGSSTPQTSKFTSEMIANPYKPTPVRRYCVVLTSLFFLSPVLSYLQAVFCHFCVCQTFRGGQPLLPQIPQPLKPQTRLDQAQTQHCCSNITHSQPSTHAPTFTQDSPAFQNITADI
ncbi:hypothetical protein SRHO_G00200360 [Serrasalmus rhombeus]